MTAAARTVRTERATSTREAILAAAERLYAEHGMFAVSNRQVSEAAGQGNNAAVGYHFGTKADLVLAIEQKHREPVEQLREEMVAELVANAGPRAGMRDWVGCLVRPLTEHLAALGESHLVRAVRGASDDRTRPTTTSSSRTRSARRRWFRLSTASTIAFPNLPTGVRYERNIMARNLLIHTCADLERSLATGATLAPVRPGGPPRPASLTRSWACGRRP